MARRSYQSLRSKHPCRLGSSARGKRLAEILPAFGDLSARLVSGPAPEQFEMRLGAGPGIRFYEIDVSLLRDFRGLLMGHLLMLRDVTEHKRAERRIIEQQRSLAMLHEREQLARELHDGIGQVLGYCKNAGPGRRATSSLGSKRDGDEYLAQLINVAQDAHADVREYILGAQTTAGSRLGFLPRCKSISGNFAANYGIRTELVAAPGLGSDAFEPMVQAQLLRIIQEALTNARKHSHAVCVRCVFSARQLGARDHPGRRRRFDPELHEQAREAISACASCKSGAKRWRRWQCLDPDQGRASRCACCDGRERRGVQGA